MGSVPRNHDANRRTKRSVSDVKGVITQADMIKLEEALRKRSEEKRRRRQWWRRVWEKIWGK